MQRFSGLYFQIFRLNIYIYWYSGFGENMGKYRPERLFGHFSYAAYHPYVSVLIENVEKNRTEK